MADDEKAILRPQDEQEPDEAPGSQAEGKRAQLRGGRRRKRRRPRSGDIFLVVLVFAIVLVFLVFKPTEVFINIYNKTAGLILIIMVVEYLVLKSMDRTRVYQLENQRLREQRRADRQRLKRAKELLEEAMSEEQQSPEAQTRWKTRAELLTEEIGEKL